MNAAHRKSHRRRTLPPRIVAVQTPLLTLPAATDRVTSTDKTSERHPEYTRCKRFTGTPAARFPWTLPRGLLKSP